MPFKANVFPVILIILDQQHLLLAGLSRLISAGLLRSLCAAGLHVPDNLGNLIDDLAHVACGIDRRKHDIVLIYHDNSIGAKLRADAERTAAHRSAGGHACCLFAF